MKAKKGLTLIEVLITGLILAGVAMFAIQGLDLIEEEEFQVDERMALDNTVEALINSINSNLAFEKIELIDISNAAVDSIINWNDVTTLNAKLPYAWDRLTPIHPVEPDEKSIGRIGYSILPVRNARGLLEVYIKVTHPRLFPVGSGEEFKTYRFLVNSL